ncbi:MAG: helix-turn-helix domain-containing protein [Phycisphaerae bacterium]|nr:helix-turn-helix domain-containing protein [Phycisphaerae bacterium]
MQKNHILNKIFDSGLFRKIEARFRKQYNFPLEIINVQGNVQENCSSKDCQPDFCKIVRRSRDGRNRCLQDRLRSMRIAFESGQSHTCFCHAGIVLVCVPIMDGDEPLGGIFFGRCFTDKFTDIAAADVKKRLFGLEYNEKQLNTAANELNISSARIIHAASEYLFILLYEMTNLDPRIIRWQREKSRQQAKIGEFIHHSKQTQPGSKYPYQTEKKLIEKVRIADKIHLRETIDSILGTIIFSHPGSVNILKVRLLELLAILSRAASEGGANIDELLSKSASYINKVISLDTQEDICAWFYTAVNDFIDCVSNFQAATKTDRLKPAIDFMLTNCVKDISLQQIAQASHFSVSRLCHLFKEQMGITVIDYLRNIRISRAKHLLLTTNKNCTEICFICGFSNQSYFNRTFKKLTGMPPNEFRKRNL